MEWFLYDRDFRHERVDNIFWGIVEWHNKNSKPNIICYFGSGTHDFKREFISIKAFISH